MKPRSAPHTSITFDTDLYNVDDRFAGYDPSIPVDEDDVTQDHHHDGSQTARKMASYTAPKAVLKEIARGGDDERDDDVLGFRRRSRIIDREDDYRRRRLRRAISPERSDPFASGDKTPDESVRTYRDVMWEERAKKSRNSCDGGGNRKLKTSATSTASDWDVPDSTRGIGRRDAPRVVTDARNRWDEMTPSPGHLADADADATPKLGGIATPTPKHQKSRWD